jgi:uncharacterized radical SAM superfamily protein
MHQKSVYLLKVTLLCAVSVVKKSIEEQIKTLLARHSFPPLEVIIPILEKAGRGEQELAEQIYDTQVAITNGVREILNLKESNMKTVARIFEIICDFYGQKIEPIELSQTRFSLSISDCPMLHVGKNVSVSVKSKFCDLCCSAGATATAGTVLGQEYTCSWDKKLIKSMGKCTTIVELRKTK